MNNQTIINDVTAISDAEFKYTLSSDFGLLDEMDYGCSGIVLEATVLHLEIKNIPALLKTGKRLAARVYKMYHHALSEAAKETKAHLSCIAPDSFLLIYPKETHETSYAVDAARKLAHLLSHTLQAVMEKHVTPNFAIGIDKGNILGTKALSDNGESHTLWIGNAINKAKAISHECNRPFYVGLSGTVYNHLDEEHRTMTKRILGFKKKVEIWSTVSYQFENIKKHLYQTNILIPFEEE